MNREEIKKTIMLLKPNNQLFEIRIIDGKNNTSGYFDDVDIMIKELEKTKLKDSGNVYITLNKINDACKNRQQWNKFIEYSKNTTSDSDIEAIDWLMIDIDPKRPSGTASTDEQIKKAYEKAKKIFSYMKNNDWYEPVIAMSGNGYHLLYKVALKNEKEKVDILKNCLVNLNKMFGDEFSDIDIKTFNPSRICKLYGTYSRKGNNSVDRPHRQSKLVYIPNEIKTSNMIVVKKLSLKFDNQEFYKKNNSYSFEKFNLQDFMSKHGIEIHSTASVGGTTRYELEHCPFDNNHGSRESAIFENSDGSIAFNCFHNSCSDKKWQDVRMMFEPDAYNKTKIEFSSKPNYQKEDYQPKVELNIVKDKMFIQMDEIAEKEKNSPQKEYIKTGISQLDTKIFGLAKTFVTILSGISGSGKSSLINQVAIETVNQGLKVAIFSGELTDITLRNWILLQTAGRDYVKDTNMNGYYTVNEEVKPKIDMWMKDKLFIYNNDSTSHYSILLEAFKKIIEEKKVDLIILDNLMMIDFKGIDGDKWEQQSQFVGMLQTIAKSTNIHIVMVAHPKKNYGFMRANDISGSGDIRNRADNLVIVHRVNNDFKIASKEVFKGMLDEDLYNADNVVEISKARDNGTQDFFIPLYFDKTCKRLNNYRGENKLYKWYFIGRN